MKRIVLILALALSMLPVNAQRYVKSVATIQAMKDMNTADISTALLVSGYTANGDGGGGMFIWDSSSTASTNWGTVFKGKTTGSELTTGRWLRVMRQAGPMDIAWFGVSNATSDQAKFTNALALSGRVIISVPITINTNSTTASTNTLEFTSGGNITMSSSAVLTFSGDILAPNRQIFNIDSSGATNPILFPALSGGVAVSRVREILGNWFGITGDGGGSDQNRFAKWIASAGSKARLVLTPGSYATSATLTIPSGCTLEGLGAPNTVGITFKPTSDNQFAFLAAPNGNDITFKNISFGNGNATTGNTVVGTSGLQVGAGTVRLVVERCRFSNFHGYGVQMLANSLHSLFRENLFFTISNSSTNFGTGSTPAWAFWQTNVLGGADFEVNRFATCDQAMSFNGASGGGEIVGLSLYRNKIEQGGRSELVDNNTVEIRNATDITWVGNYMEANQTATNGAGVFFQNIRSVSMNGGVLSADKGGVVYSENMLKFDGIDRAVLTGIRFNNIGTNGPTGTGGYYIWATNFVNVRAIECSFDLGVAGVESTPAQINARILGPVTIDNNLIRRGAGSPESVVTGVIGDIWIRTDGGAGTIEYVKESGTGNTGWIAHATPPTDRYSGYASGTVYSLTATPALLDFGTTDPTITLSAAGTYLIQGNANLTYNGATYVGTQTATVKFRRTNNTAADLTSGSRTVTLNVVTTSTGDVGIVTVPPVIYTAGAGDIIQLFGSVSATPSAGSIQSDSAEIVAVRIQ